MLALPSVCILHGVITRAKDLELLIFHPSIFLLLFLFVCLVHGTTPSNTSPKLEGLPLLSLVPTFARDYPHCKLVTINWGPMPRQPSVL